MEERKKAILTQLVGMQISPDTMEISMDVPQKKTLKLEAL